MRKELDDALVAKYPEIFRDRYEDMQTTAMCWGFECGDGWYNLIDTLCGTIQSYITNHNNHAARTTERNNAIYEYVHGNHEPLLEILKGNTKLVDWYLERGIQEVPEIIPQVVATQVKEKFGGLRFYYTGGDRYISGMAILAENLAERTCEVCGAPGKLREGSWIVTRCDEHDQN